jgi:C4-dicarboxylate-specific signal transduction histidine kinase
MRWQFLSVAAVLLILAAALYLFDANLRARPLADADAARAQLVAGSIDRTLQWRMTEAFTFAALPSLRGFAAADETALPARTATALVELKAIVAADPAIRAASIVDPLGEIVLTTDASMHTNWAPRLFVREALAGHLYASVPSRDFGEVSQYYSAPIIDNAGNVAAALVLRVAVQELAGALDAPPDVLLVDENGVRIADRSAAPQSFVALVPLAPNLAASLLAEQYYGAEVTQLPATDLAALDAAIKRGNTATLTYLDANHQSVHAALRRLATNSWTVVVYRNEDAMLAPTRDALMVTLVFGGTAFIAGAFVWSALRGFGRRA